MLTTFNEVDMSAVMALRAKYQDRLRQEERRQARLHVLLREGRRPRPEGGARGQRADRRRHARPEPFLRHRRRRLDREGPDGPGHPRLRQPRHGRRRAGHRRTPPSKAREGKITLADLEGGVFTITNGGVFGSLLSTPIINPPQSAILGMHAINERPVAIAARSSSAR
jgi:2-oxoglutarate dehydrogenase E2 component (dihydrolipoamide succinyltransferase)